MATSTEATFLGHPRGLLYLSLTEVWERFSFYGMQALLVLYMVDHVLTPGHIETIRGMGAFRAALEGVFGPLSIQALSSQIFGLYTGLVYLTPLVGGWLGDQVLGRKRTVILGAVLMAAGHAAMAFEMSFLIALALLILGSGCLKGNISAQVGALYPAGDPRRTPAFSLFNLGINIGAFAAPIACGTVGEVYGWHYGFGLAAIGMLAALAVYILGGRDLPPDTLRTGAEKRPGFAPGDGRKLFALIVVLVISTFYATAYSQEFNVFNLWARKYTDLHILGFAMPVTWYPAFDGLFIVVFMPLALRYWSWQLARGRPTSDLAKIGWSGVIGALGMLSLVAASLIAAAGGKPGIGWGAFCFAAFAWGFIYNWPTTLAVCSRAAPAAVGGVIMGAAFLTNFVSNYLAGWIGTYYETMPPAQFWGLHAAISIVGGVLMLIFHRPLARTLGLT